MQKVLKNLNKPLFYWIGLGILIFLAIFSHFYLLGWRPPHHDEGMLAYFAWKLSSAGEYTYTPQIHCPILFYVQAIIFKLFGAGQETLRTGSAIFGTFLVFIPLFFRKHLKGSTAIWLSVLFLLSPIVLYFTRFLVHTGMVIIFWLLTVLCIKWFYDKPSMLPLHLIVLFLAFAFGTSESTYIFAAVLALFVPILFVVSRDKFNLWWKKTKQYFSEDPYQLLSAFLLFVTVWILIYSVGATNWQSLQISFPNPFSRTTGLGFWLAQHPNHLGGQPWFYYLMLVFIYEPAIIIADIFAIFALRRNKSTLYLFAIWWAIASSAAYAWAGEKFPWLTLCQLVAMIFLAGLYFGESFGKFKPISKIIFIVLIAFGAFNGLRVNFFHPSDTKELLTYVQTPEVFQDKIDLIQKNCNTTKDCVAIDQSISWPMSWSFKESSYLFYPESDNKFTTTKYIILSMDKANSFKEPEKFKKEVVQLRDWWVPDKCPKFNCFGKYWNYYLFRTVYSPKGGFDVYLYTKLD